MPDLLISELSPGQEHEWDSYVRQSSQAGFFPLVGWKRVIEKTYGHETRYLMAREGGEVRGILPLFIVESRLFGIHVSSVPGGICTEEARAGQALLQRAMSLTEETNADDLLLSAGTRVWDGNLVTVQRHVTQRLALPADPAQLWKNISRHKRKNVNAASRAGLSVALGKAEHLEVFYEVFSHNLRDLGTPVFPKRLVENILTEFPEETHILVVKKERQPIGALLLFAFQGVIYAHWAASFQRFRPDRPNDLLYWEMMRWGCEQGFHCCNMGRSQWGSGNYEFKTLWGAETQPLYYQYYLRRGVEVPDFDLRAERVAKYRWAVKAWQRLPVGITRRVGPYFRKYLYPL